MTKLVLFSQEAWEKYNEARFIADKALEEYENTKAVKDEAYKEQQRVYAEFRNNCE